MADDSPLAASLAKVAAIRAEFPEWYLAPDKPRGWVAGWVT